MDKGLYIKADPLSVNRIINNLVENAIKFSQENGAVVVALRKEGGQILFSVKDQGPGIPVKMQAKVFEPYYQISGQKTNAQGMGLGLPIVKKVVEDLGGTIAVVSRPEEGSGTEMQVRFQAHELLIDETISHFEVARPSKSAEVDLAVESFVHDSNHKTIMIVEDNGDLLRYLVNKLRSDYNVYPALNGNEALKKLNSLTHFPDLIISDVMMDKLDGFSLAKIVSKNSSYHHIPFLFLTAKATSADRLHGLKLGAVDVIQKPFSIPELLYKVQSIISLSEKQRKAIFHSAFAGLGQTVKDPPLPPEKRFENNVLKYGLTSREKDIAELVCQGYKYKDIGEKLFISEKTVAKHVQNIFEKVGVSNKIELMNKLEADEGSGRKKGRMIAKPLVLRRLLPKYAVLCSKIRRFAYHFLRRKVQSLFACRAK